METVTLVIILLVPLVVLGALAMAAAFAFAVRTRSIVSKASEDTKPKVCPNCGHTLVEVRNFCAECGANIRKSPTTSETPPPKQ